MGLGNSHEKYLYLTQSDTDFIFAIIGEELGLVGAAVVITLFLLFCGRACASRVTAPDNFGTMVAGGCTIMIVFQAFLNIAMVIGWFPVVGKPLPFISSGGSSLVAMLIMVGSSCRCRTAPRTLDVPTIADVPTCASCAPTNETPGRSAEALHGVRRAGSAAVGLVGAVRRHRMGRGELALEAGDNADAGRSGHPARRGRGRR